MTVTVTPTLEAGNVPPRVRLDVLSTGTGLLQATPTRLDADGRIVPVRTPDGNPLTLSPSGGDMAGLVYDYEAPFGTVVQYGASEGAVLSSPLLVDVPVPWLIHVGIPTLSVQPSFAPGSFQEEIWDVAQGVFWPLGRTTPVVVTDGARKSPQSSMTVILETPEQRAAVRNLLASASTLLLNLPVGLGAGVDACYVAVGRVSFARFTDTTIDDYRHVVLPYTVVDRPVGGSQSQRSYADVLAAFSTYGDVLSAYSSYADLLAPTS